MAPVTNFTPWILCGRVELFCEWLSKKYHQWIASLKLDQLTHLCQQQPQIQVEWVACTIERDWWF